MNIHTIVNTLFASNTYILNIDSDAVIIDPGSSIELQISYIESMNLNPKAVLATHGHIDHIIGVAELCSYFDIPFYIHRDDVNLLSDSELSKVRLFIGDLNVEFRYPDGFLEEGGQNIGGFDVEIIHTPGHTYGSVCIKVGDKIFTGDTIFRESIGRTDFGGDINLLVESIHKKLFEEPDDIMLYPGHGPTTTVGHEKIHNPFVGINGIYPYKE